MTALSQRYGRLLSEMHGFEALATYYAHLALCKQVEMERFLDGVFGRPQRALPKIELCKPKAVEAETTLDDVTRLTVAACLAKHKGNVELAAKELGVHRATVYRRLEGVVGFATSA